jgi:hypothetical protein
MRRSILTAVCVLGADQIPSLPPEWGPRDPTVFRCHQAPGSWRSSRASALFSGAPDPDSSAKPVLDYPLPGAMHLINSADITFRWRRAQVAAQTAFRIRLLRADGDAGPCAMVAS